MGTCYRCKGDQYVCDYLELKSEAQPVTERITEIPPLAKFCVDCGVKHIVQDYPTNPESKGKKMLSLNWVEVVQSQSSPNTLEVVPLQVLTPELEGYVRKESSC